MRLRLEERCEHVSDYRFDYVKVGDEMLPSCRICCTVGHICINCVATEAIFYQSDAFRDSGRERPTNSLRWTEVFKKVPQPAQSATVGLELGVEWQAGCACGVEVATKAHMPLCINGVKVEFVNDTGASHSFTKAEAALEAGLVIEDCLPGECLRTTLATGGPGPVVNRCVRNVQFDHLNKQLYVAPMLYIMSMPRGVSGIIGRVDHGPAGMVAFPHGAVFYHDQPKQTMVLYQESSLVVAAVVGMKQGEVHLVEMSEQIDVVITQGCDLVQRLQNGEEDATSEVLAMRTNAVPEPGMSNSEELNDIGAASLSCS